MRADPFSRPQAGYYGGGYQAEPEPGLNDPGGVGVTRGNIRPRMTGGGAPMSRPGVPGSIPMQTGGGAPMQPAQNTGVVPPHLQTGGPGQMTAAAPGYVGAPPSPMQFPQVGNPGLPPGAQLPPGGAISSAPGFGSIEQMANPAYLQHLARLHALRGGY